MGNSNLLVYKKTEDLLYRLYPRLVNFPKSEKFSLCHEIKDSFYNILKCISLGNNVPSKRKVYLQEADAFLQVLKIQIKVAHKQKYISTGFFRNIDLDLTEINKMLAGYIRSTSKR